MADQVEALAIELRSISDGVTEVIPAEASLTYLAARTQKARAFVDNVFEFPGFAASPAWDFMLDLYTARAKYQQVSVSSASLGARCPATTGLRWIQILEDMKLIHRIPDEHDKRRVMVALTQSAVMKVSKALEAYY